MKTLALFTTLVLTILLPVKKADTYKVNTDKSSINWVAKKVTGQHEGTLKIKSGALTAEGKNIKGGSFLIDMASINNTDLQGDMRDKLQGHLKSDDFFSVDKFPTANFSIVKIMPAGAGKVNISGNLTIKGKTASVTFPADVTMDGNTLTAKANSVKVDRTKYDIKFRSKNFFENLGDKAIEDEFELSINLIASK